MPLTFGLEIQQGSRGCRGTCACKISSSWVQRFTSYLANREKTLTKTTQSVATARTVITANSLGAKLVQKLDNGHIQRHRWLL